MKGVRAWTRHDLVRRILGPDKRLTVGQMQRSLSLMRRRGWLTATPADGPAYERVAVVNESHPLAAIVREYIAGTRWFERARVEKLIGAPLSEEAGARRLGKAGLAITQANAATIQLQVTDPRGAQLINRARCGTSVLGFGVRRVIEAFVPVRQPGRSRVNVDDDRRLRAAIAMDGWGISCDDLLVGRKRVRLSSSWTHATVLRAAVDRGIKPTLPHDADGEDPRGTADAPLFAAVCELDQTCET